jgi:hypothetical protein
MKNTPEMSQRKKLIAEIAMRHRAENDLIKSFQVQTKNQKDDDQYTQIVEEEFQKLRKLSIAN